jgi:hypothetical protein
MMKNLFRIFLIVFFLAGCVRMKSNSVVTLDYQGYGDTIFALIYGKIIDFENHPQANVKIQLLNSGYKAESDSLGKFEIYSNSGTYDISIKKEAFQSVLIKGYVSQSDQITQIKIKLSSNISDTLMINGAPN